MVTVGPRSVAGSLGGSGHLIHPLNSSEQPTMPLILLWSPQKPRCKGRSDLSKAQWEGVKSEFERRWPVPEPTRSDPRPAHSSLRWWLVKRVDQKRGPATSALTVNQFPPGMSSHFWKDATTQCVSLGGLRSVSYSNRWFCTRWESLTWKSKVRRELIIIFIIDWRNTT